MRHWHEIAQEAAALLRELKAVRRPMEAADVTDHNVRCGQMVVVEVHAPDQRPPTGEKWTVITADPSLVPPPPEDPVTTVVHRDRRWVEKRVAEGWRSPRLSRLGRPRIVVPDGPDLFAEAEDLRNRLRGFLDRHLPTIHMHLPEARAGEVVRKLECPLSLRILGTDDRLAHARELELLCTVLVMIVVAGVGKGEGTRVDNEARVHDRLESDLRARGVKCAHTCAMILRHLVGAGPAAWPSVAAELRLGRDTIRHAARGLRCAGLLAEPERGPNAVQRVSGAGRALVDGRARWGSGEG